MKQLRYDKVKSKIAENIFKDIDEAIIKGLSSRNFTIINRTKFMKYYEEIKRKWLE